METTEYKLSKQKAAMKKLKIISLSILLTSILFSCSVSEKVEGVYNGHWDSSSTSSTLTILTNGSDKVDIQTGNFGTNTVNVSSAGNGVAFSYNNPDAVNHADMKTIQGSFIDNHITISFEIVYTSLPYTQTSIFEGTKQ